MPPVLEVIVSFARFLGTVRVCMMRELLISE